VFDGGGHTISGLYINSTDYDNTGLFGGVSGNAAVVKNLGVIGADVTGNNDVGGVAGYVSCGTVQDCYVTGAVTSTYTATLTVSAEDMTPAWKNGRADRKPSQK
jgi:hypothetical protein